MGKGQFDRVLNMTSKIRDLGMEVCATLGMLTPDQAVQLRAAGLTAYNHNLDTSPEFYGKISTTRTYSDRLQTLAHVREAGISVCCGGILGLGEDVNDRVGLLHTLATLPEHPESVPVNALVPIKARGGAKRGGWARRAETRRAALFLAQDGNEHRLKQQQPLTAVGWFC